MSNNIEQSIEKTDPYNNISPLIINNSNTKKEKKKRTKKIKSEKSKHNISSKSNNNINNNNNFINILSEIKQISIPEKLTEKEDLYKILQNEIINIDKGLDLLNKKKKYYDEIIRKLEDEIQNEKKNIKKNEIKNQEYLYMENILKSYNINDTFDYELINDNKSYYNNTKFININLDYNNFLLNQKNNKNFLIINFFSEKNITKFNTLNALNSNNININKMEPNFQMSYEEFNNIDDMENNFCILMHDNTIQNKQEEKIILNNELEQNNNNSINLIKNTPIKNNFSEIKDEFTIINEVPPEEEETNNKKKKKISMTDSKNKIDKNNLDKNINKEYSNSNEDDLDFYLLKNRNNENNEINHKKNSIDINKKYKVQDMGSDFLPSESVSSNIDNTKEIKKNKKKKKKKKDKNKDKSDSDNININIEDNNIKDLSKDKSEENSNIEDDSSINNNNNKKKKRGRKKKKKETESEISFNIEEEYPDPENLDSTALSLEMKKYGMKPQNKKKNIEILKSVYNFLKIKEMPENIQKKLTNFDVENNEQISDSSDNDNIIGSKKNENINEINDETKKKIIEIIKDNKNIYEKILLFKEVSLKDIKNILNSKGIIVPNHSLSQLLINSGVILPGGWNNKK